MKQKEIPNKNLLLNCSKELQSTHNMDHTPPTQNLSISVQVNENQKIFLNTADFAGPYFNSSIQMIAVLRKAGIPIILFSNSLQTRPRSVSEPPPSKFRQFIVPHPSEFDSTFSFESKPPKSISETPDNVIIVSDSDSDSEYSSDSDIENNPQSTSDIFSRFQLESTIEGVIPSDSEQLRSRFNFDCSELVQIPYNRKKFTQVYPDLVKRQRSDVSIRPNFHVTNKKSIGKSRTLKGLLFNTSIHDSGTFEVHF